MFSPPAAPAKVEAPDRLVTVADDECDEDEDSWCWCWSQ